MLRVLFFAIKVGVLVAAAVWVANRPGFMEISWLGYDVRIHIGLALLAFLLLGGALSLILKIVALPGTVRRWRVRKAGEKGYRALTLGLSCVAAGDVRAAGRQASKARGFLPKDKGLILLLEAQVARMRGDDEAARRAFKALLESKETLFLGMRGLLLDALEKGRDEEALGHARKALSLHRKQPWLLRLVYDLELKAQDWAVAEKTLKRAVKYGAIEAEKARGDRTAMLLYRAEKAFDAGDKGAALKGLKKAWKLSPDFVPATVRLAGYYKENRKRRVAVGVIEKAWRENPHPELAVLWRDLAPKRKAQDSAVRLRWFERLLALNPDDVESHLAAAQAALDDRLWGEALKYLKQAETLSPSARLYRLWSKLEEAQGHMGRAHEWIEKSTQAPAGKQWFCRDTGRIYERWSVIAQPHGGFNTIVWGLPQIPERVIAPQLALPKSEILLSA